MPRFFCENISGGLFCITGDDAKHISKVLRYTVGDELTLCDMRGMDYTAVIENIDREAVMGSISESRPSETEPNINLTLYMAMPKGDKAEFIIQKAVELGAKEVVFMLTHRCVSRPDEKSFRKKLERYQRVSFEAAKQCQRGVIPKVEGLLTYEEALKRAQNDSRILLYENATVPLREFLGRCSENISLFVGSEGGFEESEVQLAKEQGVGIASLGKRILRCETAPLAAISAIMFEKGNF